MEESKQDPHLVSHIEPEDSAYNCVKFMPTTSAKQSSFATGLQDGTVKLYKAKEGSAKSMQYDVVHEFKDHFFPVNDVCFAEKSPWLATCANDTIVNMFDYEKGQLCRSFLGGHTSFVTKCLFNKYENILLSTGTDNFLMAWDVR